MEINIVRLIHVRTMPFITFIYKIGNSNRIFYGKYACDCISDDHEGLDDVIRRDVVDGINQYREQSNMSKLKSRQICIGVMSLSINGYIPSYSTDKETKCFDFYYRYGETYVNGKKL